MPENCLHGGVLKIGRVTVLTQNSFYQHPHARPRAFTMRPIHGNAALEVNEQFVGDQLQRVISHQFDGALAFGQSVIEGNFVLGQALILASPAGGADFLGEVDQFLQYLDSTDSVSVVAGDSGLQALRKALGLDHVRLAT